MSEFPVELWFDRVWCESPIELCRTPRSGTASLVSLEKWLRTRDDLTTAAADERRVGVVRTCELGPDRVVIQPLASQRCVRPIEMKEQRDWGEVVAKLADQNACPTKNPGFVCGDCDQIWIKTAADGKYREQSCQEPGSETLARALLQLMKKSAGY